MPTPYKVVSTLLENGTSVMDQFTILWRYPDASIFSGSYLTVESNEIAVVKSRGAVLAVYPQGQYQLQTPDKPVIGFLKRELYGGTAPWLYEILFVNLAKMLSATQGIAYTRELAEVHYDVTYYFHVSPNQDDVLRLIQSVMLKEHKFTVHDLKVFVDPIVDQAINQVIQQVSLKEVNATADKLTEVVKAAVSQELREFGMVLDKIRVIVKVRDEVIKRILSLIALGFEPEKAMLYEISRVLAEKGVITTANVLAKQPVNFVIGPYSQLPPSQLPSEEKKEGSK
jgi:membrane protease subunit (stomatin/prohibitin family)